MPKDIEPKNFNRMRPLLSGASGRWVWQDSRIEAVQRAFPLLNELATALDRLLVERQSIASSGRLTEKGVADELTALFERDAAPRYRTADADGRRGLLRQIEKARAAGVEKPDPTDAAAAMLRSDLRRMWAEMDHYDRKALLAEPPALLASAVLELPRQLSGLSEQEEEALRSAAFGARYPELNAQIREMKEVAAFVETALTLARDTAGSVLHLDDKGIQALIWGGVPADAA